MGALACVSFGPEDAELTRGGPQVRRRFVDYAIAKTSRQGLETLTAYRRTVQQRTACLQDPRNGAELEGELGVWGGEQVRIGLALVGARAETLAELAPRAGAAFANLGLGARLDMRYAVHAAGRTYAVPQDGGALRGDLESGRMAEWFSERMRR